MLIGSIQKYSLYFPLKTEIILNKKHRLVSPWWLPLHTVLKKVNMWLMEWVDLWCQKQCNVIKRKKLLKLLSFFFHQAEQGTYTVLLFFPFVLELNSVHGAFEHVKCYSCLFANFILQVSNDKVLINLPKYPNF